MLAFDRSREHRLLIIPPLFDEANKFRHQIYEIIHRLDDKGIDCFCPDLPGCNESLADHSRQTLVSWTRSAQLVSDHVRATHVFSVRSGCWLLPNNLPGWIYAPTRPQSVLRSLLRARIIAAREVQKEETSEDLLTMARSDGIELAGWHFGADLIREMEEAEIVYGNDHRTIEHSQVGGTPLWLRAENDEDLEQAAILANTVEAGIFAS